MKADNKNTESKILTVTKNLSVFRICLIPVIVWLYGCVYTADRPLLCPLCNR